MGDDKRVRSVISEWAGEPHAAISIHERKGHDRATKIGRKETLSMNIITYNVRDLGRGVKWPAIRRMIIKQKIDMLCLQETKKEVVERSMCQSLWGESEVRWGDQPAVNTASGILCLWSDKTFKLERKIIGTGFRAEWF